MYTLSLAQSQVLSKLIDNYPDVLLDRGKSLNSKELIELMGQTVGENEFFFTAVGSKNERYQVDVDLSPIDGRQRNFSPESKTFCSCPYFEENGECKHLAGSFYLLKSLGAEVPQLGFWSDLSSKTIDFKRKPKTNEEPPTEFLVKKEALDRLSEILPNSNKRLASCSIQKINFFPDGLEYEVYLNGYHIVIRLIYNPITGKFQVNFPKSWKKLLPEIYTFLKNRFSEKYRDQDFLTEEIRQESKIKYLERKNLLALVKEVSTAVLIGYSGDRIGYLYSGELTGIREVTEIKADMKALFPIVKEEDFIQQLKESDGAKEAGKYNLGIGILYQSYSNTFSLIPIIGKGKKDDPDGLQTRLEMLKDSKDYRLAKPEGLTELIYSVFAFNRKSEARDEEGLWKTGVELFQRASKFPFYKLDPHGFNANRIFARDLSDRIFPAQSTARMSIYELEFLYEVQLIISFGGNDYTFQPGSKARFQHGFGFFDDKFLFFSDIRQAEGVGSLVHLLPYKFPKQQLDEVITEIIQPLSTFLPFEDSQNLIKWVVRDEVAREELYITELGGLVSFVPKVIYGDQPGINPLDPSLIIDPETGEFVERNQEAEQSFLEFVMELHPKFDKLLPKFHFALSALDFAEGMWFLEAFEKLKIRGVKTYGLENIKIKRYSPFQAKVSTQFSSTVDWFGVHTAVSYGSEVIKLSKIRKAWENGEKFVQLGDGSLGKIPEDWMRKMLRLLRSGEVTGEEVRLSKIHFMLLEDWEESLEYSQVQKEVDEKKLKMSQFEGIQDVTVSQKVKAELRPYQKAGLNWLNFLRDFEWGGILADDMGLGKTLQMITLITQLEEQNPNIQVLIVAPTTLLFNWKKELEKFAPHLDFWIHHGQRYETAEELTKHQLVLTSYGLVINDLEILKEINWDLIVADESQAIKNTGSLRYKAMMRLKGKQRVALSGTPIENGIQELYAQMNFTNPGFFKTFHHFTGNFLTPIKKGDTEVIQSLKKQITPFVLRRTKKEVLTELPDKIEEFLYCEMGTVQRAAYEAKREEYRNFLLNKFDESGADQSKMFVLEGLTRLRQICDSPKLTGDTESHSSAKIELLKEHILEKTGNHKILIFSQFVKMLGLIREQLDQSGISYCYLDGQTSLGERERQVERFQENESVRVFLISLKAGGTGLNLTAADYVYIVDPWWNPAVENQAIDRCYRMGQDKHVVAYRMICQNSIEEKIMELQSAKSQLAKDIIGDGEGILASLDREGMLELFS